MFREWFRTEEATTKLRKAQPVRGANLESEDLDLLPSIAEEAAVTKIANRSEFVRVRGDFEAKFDGDVRTIASEISKTDSPAAAPSQVQTKTDSPASSPSRLKKFLNKLGCATSKVNKEGYHNMAEESEDVKSP